MTNQHCLVTSLMCKCHMSFHGLHAFYNLEVARL